MLASRGVKWSVQRPAHYPAGQKKQKFLNRASEYMRINVRNTRLFSGIVAVQSKETGKKTFVVDEK